jgi:hypothetical protein
MGDIITVKCVLARGKFEDPAGICDGLAFVNPAQKGSPWHWIACHRKGSPPLKTSRPQWEYEIRGDRLHFTPSLLDTSDGFHTAYNWEVAFDELPEHRGAHDYFFEINPEVKP